MMRSIKRAAATTGLAAVFVMGVVDIAEAQSRHGRPGPSSAHAANRGPGGDHHAGGGNRPNRPPPGRPSGGRPDHGGPGGGHRPPHHVDVDVDVDHDWDHRWDHHDHDVWDAVGTAAAVTATVAVTSAVIGSVTRTLPSSSCMARPYGSLTYYACGDVWYQPRYYGSNVEYIVVERPY